MDRNGVSGTAEKFGVILPVILRITFSLVLWTLGATTMTIAEARTVPTTSTKQEDSNPQLTRWAALTAPPGVFYATNYSASGFLSCEQFREGW